MTEPQWPAAGTEQPQAYPPPQPRPASTPLSTIDPARYPPLPGSTAAAPTFAGGSYPQPPLAAPTTRRVGASALLTWLPLPIYAVLVANPWVAKELLSSAGPQRFRIAGTALFPKWGFSNGDRSGRDIFDGIVKAFWTDSQGGLTARIGRGVSDAELLPMWIRLLALLGLSYVMIRLAWRSGRASFLGVWGATTVAGALAGGLSNLVYAATVDRLDRFNGPLSLMIDGLGYGAQFGLVIGLLTGLIAAIRSSSIPTT